MTKKGTLAVLAASVAIIGLGAGLLGFHSLDNGERAVARDFFGNTKVITEAGPFYNFLGDVEVYPDFMGLDFTSMPQRQGKVGEGDNARVVTINADTLPADTVVTDFTYAPEVKYNEGGIGWIRGNVQFALPDDADLMLALHKKFKTPSNLQTSLMLRTTEEALQFTAGLMSSQEAYMTHRTQFRSYAKDQIDNGLYATELVTVESTGADGEIKKEQLPQISLNDKGLPVRADESPIDTYGIKLTQFNIKDWDFEQKTKDQIALKRDAENEVITSKARTAKAEQAKLEAKAVADKNQAVAEGEANVIKARRVIEANQAKELAIIEAQRKAEVAAELITQRDNELQAAQKEAEARTVSSIAEAAARDRLIKSGGELSAEQKTLITVNQSWADAYAKRPVPQYNMGDSTQAGTSMDAAQGAMQAVQLKSITDLVNKGK